MQAIIIAIISGFFSLGGIWYQNYLRGKSVDTNIVSTTTYPSRNNLRLAFTILIGLLPWMIWGFTLYGINDTVHHHLHTYAEIMALYLLLWICITLLALASGWKIKMLAEKIILFGSLALLLYWEFWMIIVHDLLHIKSLG